MQRAAPYLIWYTGTVLLSLAAVPKTPPMGGACLAARTILTPEPFAEASCPERIWALALLGRFRGACLHSGAAP